MSWFNPSHSSLQPWLEFNGTLPSLGPCQLNGQATSCYNVCNNTQFVSNLSFEDFRDPSLAICGIWLTIVAAYTYIRFERDPEFNSTLILFNNIGDDVRWGVFPGSSLNLSSTSLEWAQSSAYAIEYALTQYASTTCSAQSLFPFGSFSFSNSSPDESYWGSKEAIDQSNLSIKKSIQSVNNCLINICSPPKLNQDLAGIGVRPF